MSDEHITGWELLRQQEFQAARIEFERRPDYQELIAAAARRGWRRITLNEQVDSATNPILWRGGVWMPNS